MSSPIFICTIILPTVSILLHRVTSNVPKAALLYPLEQLHHVVLYHLNKVNGGKACNFAHESDVALKAPSMVYRQLPSSKRSPPFTC